MPRKRKSQPKAGSHGGPAVEGLSVQKGAFIREAPEGDLPEPKDRRAKLAASRQRTLDRGRISEAN